MEENVIRILENIFGENRISTVREDLEKYGRDWTPFYTSNPSAVVFPDSIDQIQELVKFANIEKLPLVPSGGRTGLSGGAAAEKGEIVVSFEKMDRILNFDAIGRTVTAEAGVITETLQNFAREHNLFYPVDFGSRGSSQIGGNIATNAGGIRVIHYGTTRRWVSGLTVVTGKGDILTPGRGLIKDATGYDLRHLFIGSEGTLGFIVEATIQLTLPVTNRNILLFAVPDLKAIVEIYHAFREEMAPFAFEFLSDTALKYVLEYRQMLLPFKSNAPYYVLVEIGGTHTNYMEKAIKVYEQCKKRSLISDEVISQNETQFNEIWKYREDIAVSTEKYQPYANDISVAISCIPAFLEDVQTVLRKNYPDFDVLFYGHVGDGNLHINVIKPQGMATNEFVRKCELANRKLFEIVRNYNGSISAEHGIGLLRKPYLKYSRSEEEIEYMRAIKRVFDPNNIMNPGKIFD